MIAMVLAAGRGERLRPLTDALPKSLVEVAGETLLERHLTKLREAGIRDIVINLGWLGEQIVERIGSGARYDVNVVYSDEGDNVLETGGGIHRALPLLGDAPFLVVNADIHTDLPFDVASLDEGDSAHLVLVPTPDYQVQGDFDLRGDRVMNTPANHTFSGVATYRPSFFEDCAAGRFSVVPMLRAACDRGELSGSLYQGHWADTGTAERLAVLENRFAPG